MTRQEKYPDTSSFHFYNANPKGRYTTDCVIRAISAATEIPYNTVVMELAEMQCKTGFDDGDPKLIDRYLKSKGWTKHKQPRKYDNTKFTGREFCDELKLPFGEIDYGRDKDHIIANIGGHHIVAIVNGRVWDIWNSTHGCIGNYWTR